MRWIGTLLGGKLLRQHTDTELEGQGAAMDMVGIFLASDRQHMDIDSFTDHIAPHTKGDVLYRGIIRDRARTIFQGLIKVQKAAQQTDSYLANHNLLLSPKARADSIPTLEIEANDVRCTHGATVGRVDEEQLFYLRSRGLSHDEAERLIVAGFVEPVLARIPAGPLRDHTRMAVEGKLGLPLPLEEEDALQHTNDASSLSRR
jgi:Fe-S cluster assembly protein SufD